MKLKLKNVTLRFVIHKNLEIWQNNCNYYSVFQHFQNLIVFSKNEDVSRIFVEDFVNSNQKSGKSNYNFHSFFKNFQNLFVFSKNEDVSRFFVEDFVNSNQKSDKTNTIITRFFKIYSFFQKTKIWVVFSLMISLIRTKILKKQLQLLLVFSKFNRFFNKRLIFPKTNLFLRQFNRFFQKNDLKCSVFSKKNLQMGTYLVFKILSKISSFLTFIISSFP